MQNVSPDFFSTVKKSGRSVFQASSSHNHALLFLQSEEPKLAAAAISTKTGTLFNNSVHDEFIKAHHGCSKQDSDICELLYAKTCGKKFWHYHIALELLCSLSSTPEKLCTKKLCAKNVCQFLTWLCSDKFEPIVESSAVAFIRSGETSNFRHVQDDSDFPLKKVLSDNSKILLDQFCVKNLEIED